MVIVEALGVVGNSSEENDEEDKMKMIEKKIENGMSTMSTQLTGFKTILESVKGEVEGIKSGQMEAMDQVKKIVKSEIMIADATKLVPQELNGLVVFKTFPSTGNLYALVNKSVNFQDAQVTQLQTAAAMMTEMKI